MPGNVKPAVKPRNRPHSQHNPMSREGNPEAGEQTQMVNLRNNRRSLDCSLSESMAAGGTTNNELSRTAGGTANNELSRAAGGPSMTTNSAPRTAGGVTASSAPRTAGGTTNIELSRTAGSAPRAAARPRKAADPQVPSGVDNSSGARDSGTIRGYLTRPWNSDTRTPDSIQTETTHLNGNTRTDYTRNHGNDRGYVTAPWNRSQSSERALIGGSDSHPNPNVSRSRSLNNDLNQSRTSVEDGVDSTDRLHSRRNSDDSISNFELRRTSSVQAKKQFMVGSYIILFIGILLAVSGAVLTFLAFHNHFGHISIGQQWSLAGIVLMTIGICLLLTYTVAAAKNKYWTIQDDIHLEGRGGNYSRNLEQSSSVYMSAPYGRESRSEPPGGYHRATGEHGVGSPGGYYRLARDSPSLHSSAAASTSQFTETSSVDLDEEPRHSATPSHKRIKRLYNHRYDVAGHEVESDTPSESSLHSPADRARLPDGGYRGRSLRPAPGAPGETHGEKPRQVTEPARSAPPPTRAAPEAPRAPVVPAARGPASAGPKEPRVPDSTRNSGTQKAQNVQPTVPDLIRSTPDNKKVKQPSEPKRGSGQGQEQPEVKLRPAPVLPAIARQARLSEKPGPPLKVHLPDLSPYTEVAVPLGLPEPTATGSAGDKKKLPIRPVPPKATTQDAVESKNKNVKESKSESSSPSRKPSRTAPGAPGEADEIRQNPGVATGSEIAGKPKPTPTTRVLKQPTIQQQYCCVERRDGTSGQCSCGVEEEEEGGNGLVGGHEGPCTGSSDDELAGDGPSPPPPPPPGNRKKPPPPVMKKPSRSYEDPPEEGAPPCYDEITH